MDVKASDWIIKQRFWHAEVNYLPRNSAKTHPLGFGSVSAAVDSIPNKGVIPKLLTVIPTLCEVDPLSAAGFSSELTVNDENDDLHKECFTGSKQQTSFGDVSTGNDSTSALQLQSKATSCWTEFLSQLNACSTNVNNSTLVSAYLPSPEVIAGTAKASSGATVSAATKANGPDVKPAGLTGVQLINWRLHQLELAATSNGGKSSVVCTTPSASVGFTASQLSEWVNVCKSTMLQAWSSDQRSQALKIVIQCIRLLSMSTPLEFYPSKFVLVIDMLDTLATLVHSRIQNTPVTDGGETGRNWWRKVCSIRELLPRLYLQIALLPAASLLPKADQGYALSCVCSGIRGIGDGVVNVFLRAYLCKCLTASPASVTDAIASLLQQCTLARCAKGDVTVLPISTTVGCSAPPPQLLPYSWLLYCLLEAHHALCWSWDAGDANHSLRGAAVLQPVVEYLCSTTLSVPASLNSSGVLCVLLNQLLPCTDSSSTVGCSGECRAASEYIWLICLLKTMPPHSLPEYALSVIVHCGRRLQQEVWSLEWCSSILSSLGSSLTAIGVLCVAPVPIISAVLPVLHSLSVTCSSSTGGTSCYLKPATAWLAFTAKHCTVVEIEAMLSHILRRVTSSSSAPSSNTDAALGDGGALLVTMVTSLLQHTPLSVCYSDSFLGLLGVVQQCCKEPGQLVKIISSLLERHSTPISHVALAHQMVSLAAAVHNSHSCLTTEDERRLLSLLVCCMVNRLQLPDPDLQLSLYVTMRACFSQLQAVLASLVQAVCSLLMEQYRQAVQAANRRHTTVTLKGSLARSCVANAFISIASLVCPVIKIKLYLLTASVARIHECHGQADSCLKSCIKEVSIYCSSRPACPNPLECCSERPSLPLVVGPVAGHLLTAPDPPTAQTPLYFLKGLVTAVTTAAAVMRDVTQPECLMLVSAVLGAVCGACQEELPYSAVSGAGGTEAELLLCDGLEDARRHQGAILCATLLDSVYTHLPKAQKSSSEVSAAAAHLLNTINAWLSPAEIKLKQHPLLTRLKELALSHSNQSVRERLSVL